ncbi:MAG: hypothetical protein JXQ90_11210 [Cyclobacteriaceae bacterium]
MLLSLRYQHVSQRFVFVLLVFFSWTYSFGQEYSHKFSKTKVSIEHNTYDGYQTEFDFSEEIVRKAMWKHFSKFSRVSNERSHYIFEIPDSENEGNVNLMLFATIQASPNLTTIRLALKDQDLSADLKSKYMIQLQSLLKTFKKSFYVGHYQEKVDASVKQASKLSKKYERQLKSKGNDKTSILTELKAEEQEIERLRIIIISIAAQ